MALLVLNKLGNKSSIVHTFAIIACFIIWFVLWLKSLKSSVRYAQCTEYLLQVSPELFNPAYNYNRIINSSIHW